MACLLPQKPGTALLSPLLSCSVVQMVGVDREFVEREIAEGRRQLVECGVPEADIVGVRAPFLWVDPALRQVVHELGLLYDRCA